MFGVSQHPAAPVGLINCKKTDSGYEISGEMTEVPLPPVFLGKRDGKTVDPDGHKPRVGQGATSARGDHGCMANRAGTPP